MTRSSVKERRIAWSAESRFVKEILFRKLPVTGREERADNENLDPRGRK